MTTFGKRFKGLREKRNLTQEELVNMFNEKYYTSFNKSTISQYENDKRKPEINVLENWADFFNVSIDYLLGRTEEKKEKSVDVEKDIEKVIDELLEQDGLMLCGELADEEDLIALRNSIRLTIDILNRKNKK
ncbi:helix-turn-helix domain-containing protein [Clostridioides mangenotii]|uniref:helix-turn-helix domain-containing protein n=1 Tax=Metaclostridioides mangenotii TaxID=1540 RepID=UPI001C110F02|nr:helix-turn-helix domain-containing protein [Clostridioides mangenotii]